MFSKLVVEYDVETTILLSLHYEERPLRHENITEAHARTFQWGVTNMDSEQAPCNENEEPFRAANFFRWLSRDEGYFWVSGRPGSGKSTFMKYVSDHPETRHQLQKWASSKPLVFAAHYFTIYGTEVQKSLSGLLRSLLLAIFKDHPNLMASASFASSENYRLQKSAGLGTHRQKLSWTLTELQSALKRLVAAEHLPIKMCFFIDGLDEYSGDHNDLSETLKGISLSPSVKLCISSRPWNVFEDTFGGIPACKLYMHKLIEPDIRRYTTDRLQKHSRWSALVGVSGPKAYDLIREVVHKANGIFLWVVLVTQFLRESLNNDDTLSELESTVNSYSPELDEFFDQILNSVAPMYHAEMAATLRVALEARSHIDVLVYHCLVQVLADPHFSFRVPTSAEAKAAAKASPKVDEWLSRRLNGRCRGLLEQNKGKIEVLHRTVYDFLRSPMVQERLKVMSPADFCPRLALVQAMVARMMRSAFRIENDIAGSNFGLQKASLDRESFSATLEGLSYHARNHSRPGKRICQTQNGGKLFRNKISTLLDLVDSHLPTMVANDQFGESELSRVESVYRLFLLKRNLTPDLPTKLLRSDYFYKLTQKESHLLPTILRQSIRDGKLGAHTAIATKRLLEEGHSSTQPYAAMLVTLFFRPEAFMDVLELGILVALLDYGASRHVMAKLCARRSEISKGSCLPAWALVLLLASAVPRAKWDLYETMARKAIGHAFEASDLDLSYLSWEAQSRAYQSARGLASQADTRSRDSDAQSIDPLRCHDYAQYWTVFKNGMHPGEDEDRRLDIVHDQKFVLNMYAAILSKLAKTGGALADARRLALQAIGRHRETELGQMSSCY